jgi:hypothetical protein
MKLMNQIFASLTSGKEKGDPKDEECLQDSNLSLVKHILSAFKDNLGQIMQT